MRCKNPPSINSQENKKIYLIRTLADVFAVEFDMHIIIARFGWRIREAVNSRGISRLFDGDIFAVCKRYITINDSIIRSERGISYINKSRNLDRVYTFKIICYTGYVMHNTELINLILSY